VLIDEQHPALRLNGDTAVIAEALRQALTTVVGLEAAVTVSAARTDGEAWRPSEQDAAVLEDTTLSSERG